MFIRYNPKKPASILKKNGNVETGLQKSEIIFNRSPKQH